MLSGYKRFDDADSVNGLGDWLDPGAGIQREGSLGFVFCDHDAIQAYVHRTYTKRKIIETKENAALETIVTLHRQGYLGFTPGSHLNLRRLHSYLNIWLGHQSNHLQIITAVGDAEHRTIFDARLSGDAVTGEVSGQSRASFVRQEKGYRTFPGRNGALSSGNVLRQSLELEVDWTFKAFCTQRRYFHGHA